MEVVKTYWIIDNLGNLVTTDTDYIVAKAIADELGGEVVKL